MTHRTRRPTRQRPRSRRVGDRVSACRSDANAESVGPTITPGPPGREISQTPPAVRNGRTLEPLFRRRDRPAEPAVGRLDQPVPGGQLRPVPPPRGPVRRVRRSRSARLSASSVCAVAASRSSVIGTGRAEASQDCRESRPVNASMAWRPSAVRSMTTAISASLSEASPPAASPSLVAVATTGTSSRSVQSAATALRYAAGAASRLLGRARRGYRETRNRRRRERARGPGCARGPRPSR